MLIGGITVIVLAIILAVYERSDLKDGGGILKAVILFIMVIILTGSGIFSIVKGVNSESSKRWRKDMESEYSGGLYRVIQVVNSNGEVIKEYKGKMDIQENSGDKLIFVMNGKKYIIYNNNIFNTIFVEESDEEQN